MDSVPKKWSLEHLLHMKPCAARVPELTSMTFMLKNFLDDKVVCTLNQIFRNNTDTFTQHVFGYCQNRALRCPRRHSDTTFGTVVNIIS